MSYPNIRLLTLIALFCTFDIVKLGTGKLLKPKRVNELAASGGGCSGQQTKGEPTCLKLSTPCLAL
jgi:hypothetical protein